MLFLAWGYSIHAFRRISCFSDDERFDVTVLSTYPYTIKNIKLINFKQANYVKMQNGNNIKASKGSKNKDGRFSEQIIKLIKNVPVFRVCAEIFLNLCDFVTMHKVLHEYTPDVLFMQTLLYPCYLGLFAGKNVKKVVTFWNGDVIWWARWSYIEKVFKKHIIKQGIKKVDAITVNSQSAKEACINYGSPQKKVHLIRYPGVDRKRFNPGKSEIARKNLNLDNARIIFCPRGLGEYLNSDIIILSMKKVLEKYPDTLFIITYNPENESELIKHQRIANDLKVGDNIKWQQHIEWSHLRDYYVSANLVISISSKDSLPNTMLEAMACGVPLIMGDIPQIREWIIHMENGLLVPPRDSEKLADAIISIFDNRDNIVDLFVSYNLKLTEKEFDGDENIRMVKDLVIDLQKEN